MLDRVTGIGERIAEVVISEIGVDMTRFPTEKHISKWAGVCPGNNESGGRRRSGKTTKGNRAVRAALTQAAWVAVRQKGTYLALAYERMKGRMGAKKAIVAIAHKMLVMIYHMLSKREEYREPEIATSQHRAVADERARLLHKLSQLGVTVTIKEVAEVSDAA